MKIAITSTGTTIDAMVDERFGRAKYFLVVNAETGDYRVEDNSVNLTAIQGAGVQSAQRVAELGVAWVLTGHVGPKAFRGLQAAGIKIGTGAAGTCRQTLERFKKGDFTVSARSDKPDHW
ncbi:NifB/NifX family molybdenum-iron cluster-binding protein [bacterium]|nr:NifB/NifX family molybdenum-iron cluster-binding protein [candidate division CSSED10-310 bacterium]